MPVTLSVGMNCKAYRNTGTYSIPTWTEMKSVRDMKLNLTKGEGDAGSRQYTWKMILPVLKEASIEYDILADVSVSEYDVLKAAFVNDTVLDIAISTGPIATTGNEYFRADQYVMEFARNEPLEGAATANIKHKLAYSTNPPGFTTAP